jgi:transposase InsO family protein
MDVSERRACKVISQPRMTHRYKPTRPDKDKALTTEIRKLANRHKRYGYRMVTAKLRDEVLNREVFCSVSEAKVIVEGWRLEYNNHRPHSGLGYMTPAGFAASCIPSASPTAQPQEYRARNIGNSLIQAGT